MCDELYTIFSRQAQEKNIELRFTKEPSVGHLLTITDETKLVQIITNLLNNALKFTHKGFIELKYILKDGNIIFSVQDTGIGIAKDSQEIIFERFRQAKTTISADYGGTGLGLSISKSFAEMLGGILWVESEPDKGATFYLSIPFSSHKIEPAKEKPKLISLNNSPVTILVAEDEINNYQLIEAILSLKNVTLLYAQNGFEALKICEKNPQIQLVLMDIKMPVMDGISALNEIRKLRSNLPVIAQTAYALEHDKQHFLEIGFTDYILKPIKKEDLLEKINKAIFVST
jgi:CheY-like chemotaxis protein/anti-sigma regulatory factor (Ser/Thr protein kinase)